MIGAPGYDDGEARATVSVGMTVALAAIAMTFAALLLAYAIVRAQAPVWPPPGEPPLPPLWGLRLAATAAALAGSWAVRRAVEEGARRDRRARALGAATLTGVLFLLLQLASLRALSGAGIHPSGGVAASVVFALTSFHGLHALAAVLLSLGLLLRRGRTSEARVRAVASFWHLVTVVWVVVFLAVFVA